jgi:branched-chain amino acid aminotransferase
MKINIDKTEKFYLHNNLIVSTNKDIEQISNADKIFYEVIRVIDGTPLFFDAHIERLIKSTLLSGINCFNSSVLVEGIKKLLKLNFVKEKNLKITFYCSDSNEPNLYAYYVDSHYPHENAYKQGVKLELLPMERKNPNVKIENPALRGSADKLLCLSQTHEALLVNEQGLITEGSRSNFFAIIDKTLVTPPAFTVLEGITRKMVIKLARENSIDFIERAISTSEIDIMEGAFITGTSSKVLPISKIGDHTFKEIPNLTKELMKLYDKLVESSLCDYKSKNSL